MTTVPTVPEPLEADSAPTHPSWCDASTCTGVDRLLERDVNERDVPMHRRHNHFSRAHIIPVTRVSEVEIRLEAYRDIFQPVTDELDGVLLTFHSEYCGHGGTMMLALEQLAPLATAFSSLRDLAEPDRNPLLDRVAESLRVLGVIDRTNASALLSLTALVLTDRERDAVLAQFTPGGDE